MRRIVQRIGTVIFWLAWPAVWLGVRWSHRTRIILVSEGKVLFLKGWIDAGKWTLPGGGLHRGEDPLQGVLRELREETGITLAARQVRSLGQLVSHQNGLRVRFFAFQATVKHQPKVVPQRREIAEFAWLNLDEVTLDSIGAGSQVALQAWSQSR